MKSKLNVHYGWQYFYLENALFLFHCITGCEILAKAEFANGGGSVKDRAAYYLIKDAQEKGKRDN